MPSVMSNNPFVSVVINYFNEKENITFALQSLTSQTYRNFEVILVDDASTDGTTAEIMGKYGNLLNLRTIILPKHVGLRPARNLGVKVATGQIVVTVDLHVKFDELFLERIVTAFDGHPEIGAVGCLLLGTDDKWFNKGFNTVERFFFTLRVNFASYRYVFGGAAAFNSEILKSIGYLSENEVTEDEDVSWRLTKAGWDILLLKDNVVYHKEPDKFPAFAKKLFFIGLRAAPVLSKYASKLVYPQNLIRFFVLPILLILLLIFNPTLMLLLVPTFLIFFTLVFAINSGFKDAFYGTLMLLLFTFLTTAGFYHGLLLTTFKKAKLLKDFNVDTKTQKPARTADQA